MSVTLGFLDTSAGALPFVHRGPASGPQLLVLQPLFEERNRLRRLLAAVARQLAEGGIASWIFDLPATGDSYLPTNAASWPLWRDAARLMAEHVALSGSTYVLSVRGGCLLDDIDCEATYRFAPVSGERLLREMLRTRLAGGNGETLATLQATIDKGDTLDLAGYAIPAALAKALDLAEAQPIPVRTATVGDGSADINLPGPPLWRQAEPVEAPELAAALAADIAQWIASCAAR